jgi:hypothetical protein
VVELEAQVLLHLILERGWQLIQRGIRLQVAAQVAVAAMHDMIIQDRAAAAAAAAAAAQQFS